MPGALPFPSKKSLFGKYVRRDFVAAGRACTLVFPRASAPGKPWIWRTEFFGHEPQADLALLGQGFHAAYIDMQNMYGGPLAMRLMDAFYALLTRDCGLSKKTVLEGFSRGGLFAFNWAARNPEKVACIYADAPVCDFKRWPAGRGAGKGSPEDWTRLLKRYRMTEERALRAGRNPYNPKDNLRPLARNGIPLLHVVGDADDVVPVAEHTAIVERRYKRLGGRIEVIHKPGVGHHPHSLRNPKPIVDFITASFSPTRQPRPARCEKAGAARGGKCVSGARKRTGRGRALSP